jgi:hypothetical protein
MRAASVAEDKADHDNRKLRKADRLKLALRNKDEATELFKGGNYAHATQRYIRALGHCTKFFDLSEEDKAEVAELEVPCAGRIPAPPPWVFAHGVVGGWLPRCAVRPLYT